MGPERAQGASVSIRAIVCNGRCKRHGGASTGPAIQTFGKSHHRYVHGLRTKEFVAVRKLVTDMRQALI